MVKMNQSPPQPFVIVPQTKIAFIGYLLILVSMIVSQATGGSKQPWSIPLLILYVVLATLGLYVINCTVLGHCNLYAWIMGYVLVVLGAVAVISLLMKR